MAGDNNKNATDAVAGAKNDQSAGQVPNALWKEAYKSQCPPSDDYQFYMKLAFQESYAPEAFGDPTKVMHEFDCQIHSPEDAVKYANEVLARSGDSHNRVLSTRENEAMMAQIDPHLSGIGIQLVTNESTTGALKQSKPMLITRVFADTPAEQAGLKPGDLIEKIDGENVTNMAPLDVPRKIAGAEGTAVHLTIERDGKQLEIDPVRKKLTLPVVVDKELDHNLTYISVSDFFNEAGPKQLQDALLKHKSAKGFIIDLRDNTGGVTLNAAQDLSLFMDQGLVAKERERYVETYFPDGDNVPTYMTNTFKVTKDKIVIEKQDENPKPGYRIVSHNGVNEPVPTDKPVIEEYDRLQNLVGDRPVVVLTNAFTVSSAELFTGAMHDTNHATTIGERTYGKGIGQSYFGTGLPNNTGETITSMRYFTPSGFWPGDADKHRFGLQPDIEVHNVGDVVPLSEQDKQFKAAEAYLQKKVVSEETSH